MARRSPLQLILRFGVVFLAGCGSAVESDSRSEDASKQALVWTSQIGVGSSSGTIVDPKIVVQPNGGGAAMAVWAELITRSSGAQIYRIFARHYNGGQWQPADVGCRLNSEPITDGICRISNNNEFSGWGHQVSMNDAGDAVVVWQQFDGVSTNIYARSFANGAWSNDTILESGPENAANPFVSLGRGGISAASGVGFAVWEQYVPGDRWRVYTSRLVGPAGGGVGGAAWEAPIQVDLDVALPNGGDYDAVRPLVGVDDNGRAQFVWVQFLQGGTNGRVTCFQVETSTDGGGEDGDGDGDIPPIPCGDDRLLARQFTNVPPPANPWSQVTDLTPAVSMRVACWEGNNGGGNSNVCVDIGDVKLDVSRNGRAMAVFKTFEWMLPERNYQEGGDEDFNTSQDTFSMEEIHIVADYRTDLGPAGQWRGPWVLSGYSFQGDGESSITNCRSLNYRGPTLRGVFDLRNSIMNCNLESPDMALEPDSGATAVAAYERYGCDLNDNPNLATCVMNRDIVYHWFSNSTWQPFLVASATLAPIDAGEIADAFAPKVAINQNGAGTVVFSQGDGTKMRVYANQFTGNSFSGSQILDGDVNTVNLGYFDPAVAMSDTGQALTLFIGLNQDALGYKSTGVFSATGP